MLSCCQLSYFLRYFEIEDFLLLQKVLEFVDQLIDLLAPSNIDQTSVMLLDLFSQESFLLLQCLVQEIPGGTRFNCESQCVDLVEICSYEASRVCAVPDV